MAKVNLNDIGTSFQAREALNENFRLIEQALDNTVSRDGSSPNQLLADINLNGNDLINAGTLFTNDIYYRDTPLTASLDIFVNNYEDVVAAVPTVLDAEQNVLRAEGVVLEAEENVENIQDDIINRQADIVVLEQSSTVAASTSTSIQASLQNSLAQSIDIFETISASQAEANAILGLGLGNAVVDAEGDLLLTVYDGYFDSVEIDNTGDLILTWSN